jgi:IS1 family transposase
MGLDLFIQVVQIRTMSSNCCSVDDGVSASIIHCSSPQEIGLKLQKSRTSKFSTQDTYVLWLWYAYTDLLMWARISEFAFSFITTSGTDMQGLITAASKATAGVEIVGNWNLIQTVWVWFVRVKSCSHTQSHVQNIEDRGIECSSVLEILHNILCEDSTLRLFYGA